MLLHCWEPYKNTLPPIIVAQRETPEALFNLLQRVFPDATMQTLLRYQGALGLVTGIGWAGLRATWQGDTRNYDRLKKALESLPVGDMGAFEDLAVIEAGLTGMEPVKIEEHTLPKPLRSVAGTRM